MEICLHTHSIPNETNKKFAKRELIAVYNQFLPVTREKRRNAFISWNVFCG